MEIQEIWRGDEGKQENGKYISEKKIKVFIIKSMKRMSERKERHQKRKLKSLQLIQLTGIGC